MPAARLTSSLLARKGHARPTGGFAVPAADLDQPLPPAGALGGAVVALRAPMAEIMMPAPRQMDRSTGPGGPGDDGRVNLTVRIDRSMHTRLRVLGARQHRTNQDIVRSALEAYLTVFDASCPCVGGVTPPKR
ncbi:MAG: hypothetical protein AAF637_15155 [Pseudomonadota bacterium]